jgi:hypothetical protein
MDKHERVTLARTAGRQDFDIHLLVHPLLARLTDIGAADIEISTVRDCRLVVTRDRFGGPIRRLGGVTDARQHEQGSNDHDSVKHRCPLLTVALVSSTLSVFGSRRSGRDKLTIPVRPI